MSETPVKKKRIRPKPLPARVEQFYAAIEKDELIKSLEQSSHVPLQRLCKALTDPTPGVGFFELCGRYDVSISDLVDAFRTSQMAEGVIRMMRHVPQVMEDTAIDAKSRSECCPRCDGKKVIYDGKEDRKGRQCPLCRGNGEVRVVGDKVARDLIFDSIGEKKAQAPKIAIQQNFGSLEDMLKLSQKVITQ